MPLTIGLMQEINFISKSLNSPVYVALKCDRIKRALDLRIDNDYLDIWYSGQHIWRESLKPATSNFGVESASEIARIVFLMDTAYDKGEWKSLVYIEK